MAVAAGFGGVFLRAKDPKALYAWYERYFNLDRSPGCFQFPASGQLGVATLAFFSTEDKYFPPTQPAMINLQVADLDAVLDRLAAEGVEVDPKRDSYDFGRFGWFTDPEGNRVELWQPANQD